MVERRLVHFVDEAHRHQYESGANVGSLVDEEVEVRELDRHRTAFTGRGVLVLDLGVEQDLVAELVSEIGHQPQEVGGVVAAVDVGEVEFAVAGYRQPAPNAIDL